MLRLLFTSLMMLIAVGCAGWALAAHGGRWNPRLDVLTHFAPLFLATALVPAFYALVFESGWARGALLALSGLGVVLAAALIAPEYLRGGAERAPADAPGQIKLIQLNLWDRNPNVARTLGWLRKQDADIIVVQEACRFSAALTDGLTGYHVTTGDCRVMIFSKAEPVSRITKPLEAERTLRPPIAGATFKDAGGDFTVMGTHLSWPLPAGRQQAQGRLLANFMSGLPQERLILAGDLNSTPWSFTRRDQDAMFGLERVTRGLFSWPAGEFAPGLRSPAPLLPIDHVYAGPGWRTVSVRRGPEIGSDHYPVVVVLAPLS